MNAAGTRVVRRRLRGIAPVVLAGLVAACSEKPPDAAVAPPARAASAAPAASGPTALDGWPGRWDGPEGTYLQLVARGGGAYDVVIRNLDGERRFAGIGRGDRIAFERDGRQETIRATDGDATGMKWLAGKTTCLTVRSGEGYCRR